MPRVAVSVRDAHVSEGEADFDASFVAVEAR